jgi:hypothetical protein
MPGSTNATWGTSWGSEKSAKRKVTWQWASSVAFGRKWDSGERNRGTGRELVVINKGKFSDNKFVKYIYLLMNQQKAFPDFSLSLS